jgi:hypothetical protein
MGLAGCSDFRLPIDRLGALQFQSSYSVYSVRPRVAVSTYYQQKGRLLVCPINLKGNLMCIHPHPLTLGSTVRDNLPYLILWCPDCGAYTYGERSKGPRSDNWVAHGGPLRASSMADTSSPFVRLGIEAAIKEIESEITESASWRKQKYLDCLQSVAMRVRRLLD